MLLLEEFYETCCTFVQEDVTTDVEDAATDVEDADLQGDDEIGRHRVAEEKEKP